MHQRKPPCSWCGMQFWPDADPAGLCPSCAAHLKPMPGPGLGWLVAVTFCGLVGALAMVYVIMT